MMIRNQMSLIGKKLVKAAEREFEPTKPILLPGAADETIFLRLQQVAENFSLEQSAAIAKASQVLRIQVERFNFPEWEPEH